MAKNGSCEVTVWPSADFIKSVIPWVIVDISHNISRRSLRVFLRYSAHKNGKDGQTAEDISPVATSIVDVEA